MDWILAFVIIAAALGGVTALFIVLIKLPFSKKTETEEIPDVPLEEEYPLPEAVEFSAKVVDMRASAKLCGTKIVSCVKKYWVCFEKENGEEFTVEVSEEFYQGFAIGQVGTVTMVNDTLYGFSLNDLNQ